MRLPVFLVPFVLLSAGAQAQSAGAFGNWTAACDNLRVCRALGMQPAGEPSAGFVEIIRSGEASAAPVVTVYAHVDDDRRAVELDISFDRPELAAGAPGRISAGVSGDRPAAARVQGPRVGAFLDALARSGEAGGTLIVRRGGDAKAPASGDVRIALAGAAQALRFMDERQDRAGGATALVAKGDRPAASIPAPPTPLTVATAPARRLPKASPTALKDVWEGECDDEWDVAMRRGPRAYDVGGGRRLWILPCNSAAYNYASIAILQKGDDRKVLDFDRFDPSGGRATETYLVNPTYDARALIVTARDLGRGVGDCGSEGRWAWTGEGFTLVGWKALGECRGVPSDHWPRFYEARTGGKGR